MAVSELHPVDERPPVLAAHVRVDADGDALFLRVATRLDLTIATGVEANAGLRRTAAALFPGARRGVLTDAPTPTDPVVVPSISPWSNASWLKPLSKSVAAPSQALARLFATSFDRWLATAPGTRLRALATRFDLSARETAILAAVATLSPPSTPAALAAALDDGTPGGHRQVLAALLPTARLVKVGLIRASSPLAPVVAAPHLFAAPVPPPPWRALVAATSNFPARHDATPSTDHDRELDVLEGAIADNEAAMSTAALEVALDAITQLRARSPFEVLDEGGLSRLRQALPRLLASAATHANTDVLCRAIAASGSCPETASDVVWFAARLALDARDAGDDGRARAIAEAGRGLARRQRRRGALALLSALVAECAPALHPTTQEAWREALIAADGHPALAALSDVARARLDPTYGLLHEEKTP